MLILHTADLHISTLSKTLGPDISYKRSWKALTSLGNLIKIVKPDVVVIAGDIFNNPFPSPQDILLFLRLLSKIIRLDIHVILIPGNHDSIGKEIGTALDFLAPLVSSFDKLHLALRRTKALVIEDHTFILWPFGKYPRHKDLELLKGTPSPRFGVLHAPMKGSIISASGRQLISGFEMESAKRTIRELGLSHLFMGDIHEYQTMYKGKVIFPGSLLQTKFIESSDKGVVLLDTKKKKAGFVRIPGPSKLFIVNSLKKVTESDFFQLSISSKEEAIKLTNKLPPNVIKVNYPIKRMTEISELSSRKGIGWKTNLIPILVNILRRHGVSDIRQPIRYLVRLLGSREDLILP